MSCGSVLGKWRDFFPQRHRRLLRAQKCCSSKKIMFVSLNLVVRTDYGHYGVPWFGYYHTVSLATTKIRLGQFTCARTLSFDASSSWSSQNTGIFIRHLTDLDTIGQACPRRTEQQNCRGTEFPTFLKPKLNLHHTLSPVFSKSHSMFIHPWQFVVHAY
jgi:hypothetical protein